jgi:pimeloyl-[acyl-carrier protein] methyl ester esterase
MITDLHRQVGTKLYDMSLHVTTSGRGPDIALLHGWGLHSGVWTELLAYLETRWRVTCIDLPGHGLSSTCVDLQDLDAVCARLNEVMPLTCTCVGWSMGGLIAVAYAIRYPQSVRRLVLIASQPRFTRAPNWPYAMPAALVDAFGGELKTNRRAALNRFLALQSQGSDNRRCTLRRLHAVLHTRFPAADALRAGLALLQDKDLRGESSRVACPVRLILGEHDVIVPAESGQAVVGLFANASYALIAGAGHVPFISHTTAFMQVLDAYLDD